MIRILMLTIAAILWPLFLLAGETPETELSFEPPPPPPAVMGVDAGLAESSSGGAVDEDAKTGAQIIDELLSSSVSAGVEPASPKQDAAGGTTALPYGAQRSGSRPSAVVSPANAAEENLPVLTSEKAGTRPADEKKSPEPAASGFSPGWMLFKFFAAMAIVALAMAGGYYWLKRYRGLGLSGAAGKGVLEVLARTNLEPGRSVVLIKVGERIIIAGSTPQGLSRLGEISDKEEVEALLRQAGQGKSEGAFPARFKLAEKELSEVDELV